MKYIFVTLFLLISTLHANIKEELFSLYQTKQYKQACRFGFQNFSSFKKNEELVALYGFSCLNSDYIDRLAIPITALRSSKEARANATYFAVILMQKKMLYHALIDGYDFSGLKLPSTNYILSKVFDLYNQAEKNKLQKEYIFKDPKNQHIRYKLYLIEERKVIKMVIEEFYDTMLTKKHIYW